MFLGHSLLSETAPGGMQIAISDGHIGIETDAFTAYLPLDGDAKLYDAHDVEQRTDLASQHPDVLTDLRKRAQAWSLVNDWAFEHDRFRAKRAR
jgi:hypothetical protein